MTSQRDRFPEIVEVVGWRDREHAVGVLRSDRAPWERDEASTTRT
jgi:hypothetical protein